MRAKSSKPADLLPRWRGYRIRRKAELIGSVHAKNKADAVARKLEQHDVRSGTAEAALRPAKQPMNRTTAIATVLAAAGIFFGIIFLPSTAVAAQRCTTRLGVGGDLITACRNERVQLRTRPAIGGGTVTTGPGVYCTTRPDYGRTITNCRDGTGTTAPSVYCTTRPDYGRTITNCR